MSEHVVGVVGSMSSRWPNFRRPLQVPHRPRDAQCASPTAMVWCGVVQCGVPKALLPKSNGRDVLHMGNAKQEGCVSKRVLCVVCCAPVAEGRHPLWRRAAAVQGCPGDALLLCLMVVPKFSRSPGLCASRPRSGLDEASIWAAEMLLYTATLRRAVGSGEPSVFCHTAVGSGQCGSFCMLLLCVGQWGRVHTAQCPL